MRNITEKIKNVTNIIKQTSQRAAESAITKKSQELVNQAYEAYANKMWEYISPVIALPPEDSLCAEIAEESYEKIWNRKSQIGGFILDENVSDAGAAIYVNKEKKICIIWYRWTVASEMKDLISDAQIVLDIQWIDPRVKTSLHCYDNCKKYYETFDFRVCGHSLWGTLSLIVAKHREPARCIIFNPGVSVNGFFIQMLEDTIKKTARTEKTKTYKILWDVVSTAAFIGHTTVFSLKTKDPMKLHAMANFLPSKK